MKYSFETVNCNLCGSKEYELISTKGKHGFPTNVVICKNCGLGYLNPRWDHQSYLLFYQNDYDRYYRPLIADPLPVLKDQVNPIEIRLRKLSLLPKNPSRILDIGSGEGHNLIHFKSLFQNCKLYAIEPSHDSQIHLKQFGVTIIEKDVSTSWESTHKNMFDIIIMRHVLEHFLDPLKIMSKVRTVLTSSGIVYIAVPNNLKPTHRLETSWFRNVHTFYFNKYSLKNLCLLVGLEIIELVEGDKFDEGEVYLIAKKTELRNSPNFSVQHYREQLAVFKEKLKKENNIGRKVIRLVKKLVKPYLR